MNWALNHLSLLHMGGVAKHEFYVQFWMFHAIPRQKIYTDPHSTPIKMDGWLTLDFCTNLNISFNS